MRAPIPLIDYGMGNLASVAKALKAVGRETKIVEDPEGLEGAPFVVLPGVGAFPDAMAHLDARGLTGALRLLVAQGRGLLGICLGMQLLFETSLEKVPTKGLGLLEGQVEPFPSLPHIKVPHMGWNQLEFAPGHPLMDGIAQGSHVYFVHSYFPKPTHEADVVAHSDHGVKFAAIVARNRTVGIQFHPEKSQALGLQLLDNVIAHLEGGRPCS